MPRPTGETFEELASSSEIPHISIYLPTEMAGDQTQQNSIRFKNRLTQAEDDLEALGYGQEDISNLLSPAQALLSNHDFWQHQLNGLAVLINQNQFETFQLSDEVPHLTVVSDRFHLKPLIPTASGQSVFYILALAEEGVEFYRGGRRGVEQITLEQGPKSLSTFLQWDDPETELQWHTETGRLDVQRRDPRVGLRESIFHGHGAGAESEVQTKNLLRFLRALDQAVYDLLAGDGDPPLVLLGSEKLVGHYQKINSYPNLVEDAVLRVPNELSPAEIHQLTSPKVADRFRADREQAYQRFHEIEEGRSTVDLETTVIAAKEGRVELLFLMEQDQRWGTYNGQERSVETLPEQEPGAVDLLDVASSETLTHGGRVFLVEPDQMPGNEPVAAVLRFDIS